MNQTYRRGLLLKYPACSFQVVPRSLRLRRIRRQRALVLLMDRQGADVWQRFSAKYQAAGEYALWARAVLADSIAVHGPIADQ